jgi:hypothetical protein
LAELAHAGTEPWAQGVRVYTYLVHFPAWPVPWGYEPQLPLQPPAALERLAVTHWLSLPLAHDATQAKGRLIGLYRSQLGPFDRLLHAFARSNELFATMHPFRLMPDLPVQSTAAWAAEPVANTRLVRKRPGCDIAALEVENDLEFVRLRVRTVRPLDHRAAITVELHTRQSRASAPRVVQVRCEDSLPVQTLVADDDQRVSDSGEASPVGAAMNGNVLEVRLPTATFARWGWMTVDAVTSSGRRLVDHATTRIIESARVPELSSDLKVGAPYQPARAPAARSGTPGNSE